MQLAATSPEEIISVAIEALTTRQPEMMKILDELSVPIYTTDAEGRLTYFNRACVAFSGRVPVAGEDKWCITWKLYTEEGEFLPHEQCPMALALKERRPVRDMQAIAERPDGTRVRFRPFPTPIFDAHGNIVGAVNLVVDTTDRKQVTHLRTQAQRCRRLARSIEDDATRTTLRRMADDYEDKAQKLLRLN